MDHDRGGVYAIIDNVADEITGPLTIHKHPAAAIRMFVDVASNKQTSISQHPADYDLFKLGYINADNQIVAEHQLVITGSAWLAAQEKPSDPPTNLKAI